jgi:hypothetical protein
MLYVSKIEFDDPESKKRITIQNTALTQESYLAFLKVIDELVRHGLALVPVADNKSFGPTLTKRQASDPVLLSGLAQSMATATTGGGSAPTLVEIEENKSRRGAADYVRLPRTAASGR